MSEFKSSSFRNEDNSGAPDIVGVTSFTSPFYFVPPSGTTAQRPSGDGIAPGMLRFNTDIGRLEVWRGDHWATILGESPSLDGGARGLFGGGYGTPLYRSTIDYITISTLGNAISFGSLSASSARYSGGGCSSATRGIFAGGETGPSPVTYSNIIDYVTISSTGNATDFGDLTGVSTGRRSYLSACSSSTRGVFGGGSEISSPANLSSTNTIDYITITSTANAVDFGDLSVTKTGVAACSSSTRGVFGGGSTPTVSNVIDFITISTLGNAIRFGDLTQARSNISSCSNSTRGIFAGGSSGPTLYNVVDFVTIASTGNATDFGDLSANRSYIGATSSSIRGIFSGGYSTPAFSNTIEYITIASTGNVVDFGDLSVARGGAAACSNAHGGL